MKNRLLCGYLTYVNENNKHRRYDFYKKSLDSLSMFKDKPIDIISIDNASTSQIQQEILDSGVFKHHFFLKENWYDVALFYFLAWYAMENNYEYILYHYDDFITYDSNWIPSLIEFMDKNPGVHCTRVSKYQKDFQNYYDSYKTPKRLNPDAVIHRNESTGASLNWSESQEINGYTFYTTNWHYTSRPSVWRTKDFFEIINRLDDIPVLQEWERWMYNELKTYNLNVGVMDIGMAETIPFTHSERIQVENSLRKHKVSKKDLRGLYVACGACDKTP